MKSSSGRVHGLSRGKAPARESPDSTHLPQPFSLAFSSISAISIPFDFDFDSDFARSIPPKNSLLQDRTPTTRLPEEPKWVGNVTTWKNSKYELGICKLPQTEKCAILGELGPQLDTFKGVIYSYNGEILF